jgi:predicted metal-dependent phosphoesterase TrpH
MIVRGVTHLHSTYSYDGKVPLDQLRALLVERGIQFACVTEHTDKFTKEQAEAFVWECGELSDERFVFVPGFEVPYKRAHILMIGATKFVSQHADERTLAEWKQGDVFSVLAHPHRNGFIIDASMDAILDGVEVWNSQYDGKHGPRFRALELRRDRESQKHPTLATAGLDLHRPEHLGGPEVHCEVEELTQKAILWALRAGKYTFGVPGVRLDAKGTLIEGDEKTLRRSSMLAILFIRFARLVNAALASLGLRLPKRLTASVRGRV